MSHIYTTTTFTMSNRNNNNAQSDVTFIANDKLTKASAGIVIRQLPKIKDQFKGVYRVRYEQGTWTHNSTQHNSALKAAIQQAERQAIQQVGQRAVEDSTWKYSQCREHSFGPKLTANMINDLKQLQVPEGARPPYFDNAGRVWVLASPSEEIALEYENRFKDFEAKHLAAFDPPAKGAIHVRSFRKYSQLLTRTVNQGLNNIRLPPGAKRIWFSNLEWHFACQTEDDRDELMDDFRDYVNQIIDDEESPDLAEKRHEQERRLIPQIVPSASDFPELNSVA
jgi:hypothetical protein